MKEFPNRKEELVVRDLLGEESAVQFLEPLFSLVWGAQSLEPSVRDQGLNLRDLHPGEQFVHLILQVQEYLFELLLLAVGDVDRQFPEPELADLELLGYLRLFSKSVLLSCCSCLV